MEGAVITLIICGTIAFSMYAMGVAYRNHQVKAASEPEGDLQGEVTALRDELDRMRHEVAELAERVDFTERLLARPQS